MRRRAFLLRHRRAIGLTAAVATALFFVVHVAYWHWPYRVGGAARELPLLGVALGAGAAAALLLARVVPLFRSLGSWPSAAVIALLAFLIVRGADPFAGERSWRYAPEGCDFAAAFPRRPEIIAGEARLAGMRMKTVTRAVLTDVGAATTLSAECLDFERAIAEADKPAVLAATEEQLKSAAARLHLRIERVARAGDTILLAGFSDEGRNAANEPLLRRAEARAMLGRSSLLVLWAWKIGREGESAPFGGEFFAAARPARSPH